MDDKSLGQIIYTARRSKGLTREALAAKLGCTVVTIIRWESGKTKPLRVFLGELERVLGVNLGRWKMENKRKTDEKKG